MYSVLVFVIPGSLVCYVVVFIMSGLFLELKNELEIWHKQLEVHFCVFTFQMYSDLADVKMAALLDSCHKQYYYASILCDPHPDNMFYKLFFPEDTFNWKSFWF